MSTKVRVDPSNAQQIFEWIRDRGGIAIWESENLADTARTWMTPIRNTDGTSRIEKPHWSAGRIARVVTDPVEVEVVVPKEVKRFHVAVRMATNSMVLKLTDASTKQLRRAVERAAQEHGDAWYGFDYTSHQNAVIYVAAEVVPLAEWMRRQESSSQEQKNV